jgi:hypothetical protein
MKDEMRNLMTESSRKSRDIRVVHLLELTKFLELGLKNLNLDTFEHAKAKFTFVKIKNLHMYQVKFYVSNRSLVKNL